MTIFCFFRFCRYILLLCTGFEKLFTLSSVYVSSVLCTIVLTFSCSILSKRTVSDRINTTHSLLLYVSLHILYFTHASVTTIPHPVRKDSHITSTSWLKWPHTALQAWQKRGKRIKKINSIVIRIQTVLMLQKQSRHYILQTCICLPKRLDTYTSRTPIRL